MKMDLKIIFYFIASTIAIFWLARSLIIPKMDESEEFHLGIDDVKLDDALKDLVQIEDST
jgi:hypothetical protein